MDRPTSTPPPQGATLETTISSQALSSQAPPAETAAAAPEAPAGAAVRSRPLRYHESRIVHFLSTMHTAGHCGLITEKFECESRRPGLTGDDEVPLPGLPAGLRSAPSASAAAKRRCRTIPLVDRPTSGPRGFADRPAKLAVVAAQGSALALPSRDFPVVCRSRVIRTAFAVASFWSP